MATTAFGLVLDPRIKSKKDTYNLSVRLTYKGKPTYIKYVAMTKAQYSFVFTRNDMNPESIAFREKCHQFLHDCKKVFSELEPTDLDPFNEKLFRNLVYKKVVKEVKEPVSFLLTDLCTRFLKKNPQLKLKTRQLYRTAINSFEDFKPGITYEDITAGLLVQYEKAMCKKDYSDSTISIYFRHLRGMMNYFIDKEKLIPFTYQYPFGKGGYSIRTHRPEKFVIENHEIKSVAEFNNFENPEQEYARDIWLLLYRCHGANYADLLRMKWINLKNGCLIFKRMKTETTRTIVKPIVVEISPKIQELLDKLGHKNSPYILGLLNDDYITEEDFNYKKDWEQAKLNSSLKYISEKLNLSVELHLKSARDCFANSLKRSGIAKDVIGEMMGHGSNYISTSHYLADSDREKLREIKKCLY